MLGALDRWIMWTAYLARATQPILWPIFLPPFFGTPCVFLDSMIGTLDARQKLLHLAKVTVQLESMPLHAAGGLHCHAQVQAGRQHRRTRGREGCAIRQGPAYARRVQLRRRSGALFIFRDELRTRSPPHMPREAKSSSSRRTVHPAQLILTACTAGRRPAMGSSCCSFRATVELGETGVGLAKQRHCHQA